MYVCIDRYTDVPELARMLTTMGETPLSKEELAEFLAVGPTR